MALPDILVIGAGVSGLSTAVSLAEAGWAVAIRARLRPRDTTSAVAGASWGPYMVADPRVARWSDETRLVLEKIAAEPGSGVDLVNGLEAADEVMPAPDWAPAVPDFRLCRPDELAKLPARYHSGWRYTIPLVDMPVYLGYLERRLASHGVRVRSGTVDSFAAVRGRARAIVNCTGLGSRQLVPDPSLFPSRGQLVVLENPGVRHFFQDHTKAEELTYILPHGDRVVLGGCATDHSEHDLPVRETARAIIERCAEIEPALRGARFIADRVGLRPARDRVRTELDQTRGFPVIHNYGHGGAGLTLSWGCANEVTRLVTTALGEPASQSG